MLYSQESKSYVIVPSATTHTARAPWRMFRVQPSHGMEAKGFRRKASGAESGVCLDFIGPMGDFRSDGEALQLRDATEVRERKDVFVSSAPRV